MAKQWKNSCSSSNSFSEDEEMSEAFLKWTYFIVGPFIVTICKAHLNYVPNRHQYEHFNDSKFLLNSKHHGKGKHEVDKDNIFAKSQLVSNVLLTYNLMAMDTTLQVHVLHHEGFTFLQNLSHQDYDT
jgi:hypothetical protein